MVTFDASPELPVFLTLFVPISVKFVVSSFTNVNNAGALIPIGPVGPSDLRKTVARHHALLIPSLLESFGLTYFEAMSFGRTVIAADTEYARAACGDAAFYFRPCDASDALLHIQLARESIGIRSQRLAIGLEIAKQFPRVDVSMRCLDQLMFEIAANQEMMP